jgi:large subunit ribosomal protein L6
MSRVGKKPLPIPAGVTATVEGDLLRVKGPKGELTQKIHPRATVAINDGVLTVTVKNEEKVDDRALWGLYRRLAENMVKGVTEGFQKQMELNGVGFKVSAAGNMLKLDVGFSHEVNYEVPKELKLTVEKNLITIAGADKQLVGEISAQIRKIKKPEPYKGKGIKYVDEVIVRKAGKAAKAGSAA